MADIIIDYFMGLFQSNGVSDTIHLLSDVNQSINEDMNQLLITKYKEDEIIEALNNIRPTKASRPDGFPAIFFQKFWHIVGREVSDFCLEVLNEGKVFTPKRGLHQGDPLSPFLFLICSEGLSTLLRLGNEERVLRGVKARRKGPQITHLIFTNGCVLFGEATDRGTTTFEKVLKEYKICSRQYANYGKSTMFFNSNTIDTELLF
ncbi:hypothetical protein J1N35_019330 [Gossypium stocksii]|uniref:Reverse transcriptase domain-containing protein n=1 Tax=Gossypium stocksii TaxID=47602 RepID=A0A9D3VSZ1_9ROSI|nr:hypothetical protein J1N35_019330 [Gossypium stocksii]